MLAASPLEVRGEEQEEDVAVRLKNLFREKMTRIAMELFEIDPELRNNSTKSQPRRLQLEERDFDELNEILQGVSLTIEGFSDSTHLGLFGAGVSVDNIVCYGAKIREVDMVHYFESAERVRLILSIPKFDFQCSMKHSWNVGVIHDSGTITVESFGSGVAMHMVFLSEDYDTTPPYTAISDHCYTDVKLSDLIFSGSVASLIFDWLSNFVINTLQIQLNSKLCGDIGPLTTEATAELVSQAGDSLLRFVQPIEPWRHDTLYLEKQLKAQLQSDPSPPRLMDWNNPEGPVEETIVNTIDTLNQYFKSGLENRLEDKTTIAPETPPDIDIDLGLDLDMDLGMPALFVRNFIGDLHEFEVSASNLPFDLDPVLFFTELDFCTIAMRLLKVKLIGLNSFTDFDPASKIGDFTYQSRVGWQNISVQVDMQMHVKQSSTENPDTSIELSLPEDVIQNFSMKFGLEDLRVHLAMLLPIDKNAIDRLQIGSLLFMENLIPCFWSVFHDSVGLSTFNISLGNIQEPKVSGFVSSGSDHIITELADAFFMIYEKILLRSLPIVFQTYIRDQINVRLRSFSSNGACPSQSETSFMKGVGRFVDFRNLFLPKDDAILFGASGNEPYGDLIPFVFNIASKRFFNQAKGLSILNELLITPYSVSQSGIPGNVQFSGSFFNQSGAIWISEYQQAKVTFALSDINFDNINTLGGPLSLFKPMLNKPHMLKNKGTFAVAEEPLEISARFMFIFSRRDVYAGTENITAYNDFRVRAELFNVKMTFGTLIKVLGERITDFPIRDIFNSNCWIATIPAPPLDAYGIRVAGIDRTVGVSDVVSTVKRMDMNVDCRKCTSPGIHELIELLETPEAKQGLTAAGNEFLKFFSGLASGTLMQTYIDRYLHEAVTKCPHTSVNATNGTDVSLFQSFADTVAASDEDSLSSILKLFISVVCIIAALMLIVMVIGMIARLRHRKWTRSLQKQQVHFLITQQRKKDEKEKALNKITKSMFKSNIIPLYVRYLIPLILLGNVAFFLSGHLSKGATVDIRGTFAGEKFALGEFFSFSMAKSTVDLYRVGAYELATIIFIFSGIWPYTKLFITISLWFLPPTKVSVTRRGSILLWLDALAKWSMIDIFAFVVTIVSFRVHIVAPNLVFLPESFYSVHLFVVPLWGLYANMIAQILSQISSHFIIYYHRQIVDEGNAILDRTNGNGIGVAPTFSSEHDSVVESEEERLQLCNYVFSMPHLGRSSEKFYVSSYVNYSIGFIALSLILILVSGCSSTAFSVETLGIVGVLLEAGQDFNEAIRDFSVFTMVSSIMSQAKLLGDARQTLGFLLFSALFLFCVLIVPFLQTIVLIIHWFLPMTFKVRKKMLFVLEILQAWQYCEVFVISVIGAAWQLGPTSSMMINVYCRTVNDFLLLLGYYGLLSVEDIQCFQLTASIENATYLIVAAAFLLAFLNTFVVKALREYLNDHNTEDSKGIGQSGGKLEQVSEGFECDEFDHGDENGSDIRFGEVLFTDTFNWCLIPAMDEAAKKPFGGSVSMTEDIAMSMTVQGSNLAILASHNKDLDGENTPLHDGLNDIEVPSNTQEGDCVSEPKKLDTDNCKSIRSDVEVSSTHENEKDVEEETSFDASSIYEDEKHFQEPNCFDSSSPHEKVVEVSSPHENEKDVEEEISCDSSSIYEDEKHFQEPKCFDSSSPHEIKRDEKKEEADC